MELIVSPLLFGQSWLLNKSVWFVGLSSPAKAKRVLKRSIQNLKDLLDAKKRQERERRKSLKEQGYTDEEIAEYEEDIDEFFGDVEIEDDEDFLAEMEEDDFSDY